MFFYYLIFIFLISITCFLVILYFKSEEPNKQGITKKKNIIPIHRRMNI